MRRDDPQDGNRHYFRSDDRVFRLNDLWYFTTREGDQGPFSTREQAEFASAQYVTDRKELLGFQRSRENAESAAAKPVRPSRVLERVEAGNLALQLDLD